MDKEFEGEKCPGWMDKGQGEGLDLASSLEQVWLFSFYFVTNHQSENLPFFSKCTLPSVTTR